MALRIGSLAIMRSISSKSLIKNRPVRNRLPLTCNTITNTRYLSSTTTLQKDIIKVDENKITVNTDILAQYTSENITTPNNDIEKVADLTNTTDPVGWISSYISLFETISSSAPVLQVRI